MVPYAFHCGIGVADRKVLRIIPGTTVRVEGATYRLRIMALLKQNLFPDGNSTFLVQLRYVFPCNSEILPRAH